MSKQKDDDDDRFLFNFLFLFLYFRMCVCVYAPSIHIYLIIKMARALFDMKYQHFLHFDAIDKKKSKCRQKATNQTTKENIISNIRYKKKNQMRDAV